MSVAAIVVLLLLGLVIAALAWARRYDEAKADRAWAGVRAASLQDSRVFHSTMIADQPLLVRRYFSHAIADGTQIRRGAIVEMDGQVVLRDRWQSRTLPMTARAILVPGRGFVWRANMRVAWLLSISGWDGYLAGCARTYFWLAGVWPLVRKSGLSDNDRSAAMRAVLEAIWCPSAILPGAGRVWEEIDTNRVAFTMQTAVGAVRIELTLNEAGGVVAVVGERWSNANPKKKFRYQPFGGTVLEEAQFEGYTTPAKVELGNLFGTDQYFPAYHARLLKITYL